MKKKYATPKVEMLDFDYTETVVASGTGPATTDVDGVAWKCNTWFVDETIVGNHCGANPDAG